MDDFLQQHRATSTQESTHLSLVGGKYNIPYSDMDRFFELYVKTRNRHQPLFLMERVRYPCYLFVDLDRVSPEQWDRLEETWLDSPDCEISVRHDDADMGVHFVFKNVVVRSVEHAIQEARKRFDDAFDESVYRSGLRMLGSSKNHNSSRIYRPIRRGDPLMEKRRLTVSDMRAHSILIFGQSFDLPSSSPTTTTISDPGLYRSASCIFDFGRIHPAYACLPVTRIRKQPMDRCWIIQTNERFCTNVNRDHKSNHIYMVVHEPTRTMVQRCYCTCADTGCRGFASEPQPVPVQVLYHLKRIG
jgi:hypothetical protein